MFTEDWERDFLKDAIYLQEETALLRQELEEEVARNSAIIKTIKHDNIKANVPEMGTIAPARIELGYDLPFETYRTRGRLESANSD